MTTRLILSIFCVTLVCVAPVTGAKLKPKPHYSKIARHLSFNFPREHLSQKNLNDDISSRTWTNYLFSASGLDYDHIYFLKSDIQKFRRHERKLDNDLAAGDLAFAYEVFETFKKRVRDRTRYVDELLNKGFDLEKKEYYNWKRDNSSSPVNEKEWNDIWRRKIKNEFVRNIVARELDKDASEDDNGKNEDEDLSDEDVIKKRYKRFLTTVEDNGAEWVLQRYLTSFTHAYDPHSSYMSPSTVADFKIEMGLFVVGIGAVLQSEDGAAKIMRLIPGGPAERDKRDISLEPGDKIIAVAQAHGKAVDVLHWPLTEIVKIIRGKKGTKVILTVIPAADRSGSKTRKIDLIRDEVKLEEQAASEAIRKTKGNDGVERTLGIITLPTFYANMRVHDVNSPDFRSSAFDVNKLIVSMKKKKVDGIVLDLRNNGGGSLVEAIKMVGLFIHEGPVVQVRERYRPRIWFDDSPYIAYKGPLVVLVNRLSASASEIVAAALQDYGRALIIGGSKTHGKGTVQSILEMGQDKMGAAKITTSVYYRISGASTQIKGVYPDIVLPSAYDTMDFGEDHMSNPIPWDEVQKAQYFKANGLDRLIAILRRNSEARRKNDADFKTFVKLIKQIDRINKMEKLPLSLSERKQLASSERETSKLREKLLEGNAKKDENEGRGPDLVLNESLSILAELIALQAGDPSASIIPASSQKKSLANSISEWFKKL